MKKLKQFSNQYKYLLLIISFGLFLRLIPDSHRLIWSYDQARDSFVMREMIAKIDLKLIGPQTEHYGLFHGPLYYYILAPFYFISGGDVGLPVFAMTLITLSSAIPLFLLIKKITKSENAAALSVFIFTLSYQFIEYSRWLSNFTVSIPLLCWTYYIYYLILDGKKTAKNYFLLGLTIGLAVQGELFLMSLALLVLFVLMFVKSKLKNLTYYAFGGILGVAPLLISEFKFNFRGTNILLDQVLTSGVSNFGSLKVALTGYLNHIGLTLNQTVSGVNFTIGLLSFLLILYLTGKFIRDLKSGESISIKIWLSTILVSHLILFKFNYVNAVFLDMELAILIVIMTTLSIYYLYKKSPIFGLIAILLFSFFQINNYYKFVLKVKPFDHFAFIQEPSTLTHKEEILNEIYKSAEGRPFTFSVIGTPFGVRTVWASVFELYSRRNIINIPKWYGYFAEGYPADDFFEVASEPADLHVLILESNLEKLLSDRIIDEHLGNQNVHTKVDYELNIHDTRIQFRTPL